MAGQQRGVPARRARAPLLGHRQVRRQRGQQAQRAHVDAALDAGRGGRQQQVVGAPRGVVEQLAGGRGRARIAEVDHRPHAGHQRRGGRARLQRLIPAAAPHLVLRLQTGGNRPRQRAVAVGNQHPHRSNLPRLPITVSLRQLRPRVNGGRRPFDQGTGARRKSRPRRCGATRPTGLDTVSKTHYGSTQP